MYVHLTYWVQSKMDSIFSDDPFKCILLKEKFSILFKFLFLNKLLWIQLTISQHFMRQGFGHAITWTIHWRKYASPILNELPNVSHGVFALFELIHVNSLRPDDNILHQSSRLSLV